MTQMEMIQQLFEIAEQLRTLGMNAQYIQCLKLIAGVAKRAYDDEAVELISNVQIYRYERHDEQLYRSALQQLLNPLS